METHQVLSDEEFATSFEKLELSPSDFTHEAHLRLAWIHINKYGWQQAEENINRQLLQFVAKVGAADKFNKTVTCASVRIIADYMRQSEAGNFAEFLAEYPALKSDFKGVISRHYGFDVFESEQAKQEFLQPDLLPLAH